MMENPVKKENPSSQLIGMESSLLMRNKNGEERVKLFAGTNRSFYICTGI